MSDSRIIVSILLEQISVRLVSMDVRVHVNSLRETHHVTRIWLVATVAGRLSLAIPSEASSSDGMLGAVSY